MLIIIVSLSELATVTVDLPAATAVIVLVWDTIATSSLLEIESVLNKMFD